MLQGRLNEVYSEEGFAIYIGSAANAANPRILAEAGIKYVLNVSDRVRFRRVDGPSAVQYQVPLSDYGDTPLSSVLDDCFDVINEAKANKGNVLVHCQGGVNRSPTVVIAYLMHDLGWCLRKAWDYVKERRTVASPHERYMQQLIDYEIELFGNSTLSFAEYEQTSIQASLRRIRQHQFLPDSQFTLPCPSSSPSSSSSSSSPPPTIITTTTTTSTTTTTTEITQTSPSSSSSSSPQFTHFSHHLPQRNLACIS